MEFSLYQLCQKNKKKVDSVYINSGIDGPAFPLLVGKSYQLVIHSNKGNIESGTFTVTEQGIEANKSNPPPVYPNLIKG